MSSLGTVSFSCTALMGTNKAGELKADASGYYQVVLGALNFFNSQGQFYVYEGEAKKLFESSSSFMRRIEGGNLRGEYGHPRMLPGMSMRDFMYRCNDIHEQSISHHIRKVWLDSKNVTGPDGRPALAILGEVKPSGPNGPALRESLDNPSENVCFSIRSFTKDQPRNGVIHKELVSIVTWDFVNEPGISVAQKWKSPSLEAYFDVKVNLDQLIQARELAKQIPHAMESNGKMLDELIEKLRYDRGFKDRASKPPSLQW